MNLFKKFLRHDNYMDEVDDELYTPFEDDNSAQETPAQRAAEVAAVNAVVDDPERKNADIHPASSEKVSVKFLKPSSNSEIPAMVLQLKKGNILVVDLSLFDKAAVLRTKDFLMGAVFALGGEIYSNNPDTLFLAPIGVDITGFVPDMPGSDDQDDEYEDEVSAEEDEYGEIDDLSEKEAI